MSKLETRKKELLGKAEVMINDIKAQGRAMNESERNDYDALINEVKDINETEEREQRDAALFAPTREPIRTVPETRGDVAFNGTPEYRTAFLKKLAGLRLNGEETRALEVGTEGEGGYLAPTELAAEVIQGLNQAVAMRQYAQVRTFTGKQKDWPVMGATTAYFVTEEGNIEGNNSDPTFTQLSLSPTKMTAWCKFSWELEAASIVDLQNLLRDSFVSAMGALEDAKFLVGTGSDEPTGVVPSATQLSATASSSVITGDEWLGAYFAVPSQYRRRAIWVMNDSTYLAFLKTKVNAGVDDRYLWNLDSVSAPGTTLFGRPLVLNTNVAAIASGAKVACLFDPNYYFIGENTSLTFLRDPYSAAGTGQVKVFGYRAVDGAFAIADAGRTLVMKT